MKKRHLSFTYLLGLCLSLFVASGQSFADDFENKILGGEFVQLEKGPVALILTADFQCSGVLVGAREVLTAAHCVVDSTENSGYAIIVGGEVFGVTSRYSHSMYDPNAEPLAAAPYDLGMIILDRNVNGTTPLPVLFNYNIRQGDQLVVFGYGANELSGLSGRDPWEDGKAAPMVVGAVSGGLLRSNHYLSGASVCHGDSGGPAVDLVEGYSAVAGIASTGSNGTSAGTCYLQGGGGYEYVDLQSTPSQQFLLQFPGVQFISGYRIYVNAVSTNVVAQIKNAIKSKTLATLNKRVKPIIKSVTTAIPYADGERSFELKAANKNLKAAQKARSLSVAVKSLKKALKSVQGISSLGVFG